MLYLLQHGNRLTIVQVMNNIDIYGEKKRKMMMKYIYIYIYNVLYWGGADADTCVAV